MAPWELKKKRRKNRLAAWHQKTKKNFFAFS